MFQIPTQLSTVSKDSIEAHLALLAAFSSKAFEGIEKFVDLQLNTARSSLEESSTATRQILSAKDAQDWLSVTAALAQPSAEKAADYSRQLFSIASSMQAELAKAAENQVSETSRKALELFEEMTKHAPAGSENVLALIKSTFGSANAGYEQLNKSAKQAVETIEANLNAAVTQIAQPAAKASAAARAAKK